MWIFGFAHLSWCHNGWASNILIVADISYASICHSKYWILIHYDTIEEGQNQKKNCIFYFPNNATNTATKLGSRKHFIEPWTSYNVDICSIIIWYHFEPSTFQKPILICTLTVYWNLKASWKFKKHDSHIYICPPCPGIDHICNGSLHGRCEHTDLSGAQTEYYMEFKEQITDQSVRRAWCTGTNLLPRLSLCISNCALDMLYSSNWNDTK